MRRPSTYAFAVIGLLALALLGIFVFSGPLAAAHQPRLEANRALVERRDSPVTYVLEWA